MIPRMILCTNRRILCVWQVEVLRFEHVVVEALPCPRVAAGQHRQQVILRAGSFRPASVVKRATATEHAADDQEESSIVLPWYESGSDVPVELAVGRLTVRADVIYARIGVLVLAGFYYQYGTFGSPVRRLVTVRLVKPCRIAL